jgi:plasmid stabilization system protein ParE
MELTLVWDIGAYKQFEDAIAYIEKESLTNAENFKTEISKKLKGILLQPERYPADKYKKMNDGSFRAFELFRYRISYQYKSNQIRVIRLRHTKMSPLNY